MMEILHHCNSELNEEEIVKWVPCFPSVYWTSVLQNLYLPCVITIISSIVSEFDSKMQLIVFIIDIVVYLVAMRFGIKERQRKLFRRMDEMGAVDKWNVNEFYEDYFVRRGDHVIRRVEYEKIKKVVETDTNIYLFDGVNVYIFQKNRCDNALLEFMRGLGKKQSVVKKQSGYVYQEIEQTENKDEKGGILNRNIQLLMNVLFIATLCTSGIAGNVITILDGASGSQYMWKVLLFLPIPIASIVLGIKFKRKGYKCTKNIVAGIIIGIICTLFGLATFLFPMVETDYSEVYNYTEYLDVDIPQKGSISEIEWGNMDGMENMNSVTAFYSEEDTKEMYDQIVKNEKWKNMEEMGSWVELFIPSVVSESEEMYISIYNITDDVYNIKPEKAGLYEMCTMIFDAESDILEIYYYDYLYKE